MKCPYENIQCAYLETGGSCESCEHYDKGIRPIKRIVFVILVLLNLIILFLPNCFYWIWTGKDFMEDRLNMLYSKWIKNE